MGYYVSINGTICIPKDKMTAAYEAMCELNKYDSLKNGGVYPPRADGFDEELGYNPDCWFSWLSPNYPAECKTFNDIFEHLGFDVYTADHIADASKNEITFSYSDKIGQESLFFAVLVPFVEWGEIHYTGEDNEQWLYKYEDGKFRLYDGITTFQYNRDVVIEPEELTNSNT